MALLRTDDAALNDAGVIDSMSPPISVLDLAPVGAGGSAAGAFELVPRREGMAAVMHGERARQDEHRRAKSPDRAHDAAA